MQENFQRKDSLSNAFAGANFEDIVLNYFLKELNIEVTKRLKVDIGISTKIAKKSKCFDLGIANKLIIECKSSNWTETGNTPSAKIATWNEAMYFFTLAPRELRKIFAVERFHNNKRNISLAEYYLATNSHLIPDDVEFLEIDSKNVQGKFIKCVS